MRKSPFSGRESWVVWKSKDGYGMRGGVKITAQVSVERTIKIVGVYLHRAVRNQERLVENCKTLSHIVRAVYVGSVIRIR